MVPSGQYESCKMRMCFNMWTHQFTAHVTAHKCIEKDKARWAVHFPFARLSALSLFGLFGVVDMVCCLSHVRKNLLEENMQQTALIIQSQSILKFLGSHPKIYVNKQNIGRRRQNEGIRLSYVWIRYIQNVARLQFFIYVDFFKLLSYILLNQSLSFDTEHSKRKHMLNRFKPIAPES